MGDILTIPTDVDGVVLRQLATEADDEAYFNTVDANRDHLSQFGDQTATNYPTPESVKESRLKVSDKIRMGIWDADTFVGTVNATPDNGGVEIGYWLDARYTGHGYATLAAKALSGYVAQRYPVVRAEVVEGNDASVRVLERAGFVQTGTEAGRLVFELIKDN